MRRHDPSPSVLAAFFAADAATAQETPTQAAGATPTPAAEETPTPEGGVSLDLKVIAKKLNEARINIEPRIGASTHTLSQAAIRDLPER